MDAALFFADILGFSVMTVEGAARAERALDDVTLLLSNEDELARYLQKGAPWQARFGLSDSIVLVSADTVAAANEAARLFFHLAYLNSSVPDQRILLRGAVVFGDVRIRGPIFPESSTGNVVGEAVVRATQLEKSGAKGPRLLVDDAVAAVVRESGSRWLVDDADGVSELLWLLPPDPTDFDLTSLRPVCKAAANAFLDADARVAEHCVAYIELLLRSLLRVRDVDEHAAKALAQAADLHAVRKKLAALLAPKLPVEQRAIDRLDALIG